MGKKLKPEQQKLYEFIDQVLFNEWDPIGVSDVPEARDEYYGYLPQVFGKAMKGETAREIAEYLRLVEAENMGLSGSNSNCIDIAKKIVQRKNELGI